VLRWTQLADEAGRRYNVNPALLLAQIEQESGGKPINPSSAGAEGLSQFIPSTARVYGVKYGAGTAETRSQVFGQAAYLSGLGVQHDPKQALERYFGDVGPNGHAYATSVLGKVSSYAATQSGGGGLVNKAAHIFSNPLEAGEAIGEAIGESENPLAPIENGLSGIEEVGSFLKAITEPSTWLRVAEGVGGIVLLMTGLKALTRGEGSGPVGALAGQVKEAGKTAATAAAAVPK
jgi:hypothetical protein